MLGNKRRKFAIYLKWNNCSTKLPYHFSHLYFCKHCICGAVITKIYYCCTFQSLSDRELYSPLKFKLYISAYEYTSKHVWLSYNSVSWTIISGIITRFILTFRQNSSVLVLEQWLLVTTFKFLLQTFYFTVQFPSFTNGEAYRVTTLNVVFHSLVLVMLYN